MYRIRVVSACAFALVAISAGCVPSGDVIWEGTGGSGPTTTGGTTGGGSGGATMPGSGGMVGTGSGGAVTSSGGAPGSGGMSSGGSPGSGGAASGGMSASGGRNGTGGAMMDAGIGSGGRDGGASDAGATDARNDARGTGGATTTGGVSGSGGAGGTVAAVCTSKVMWTSGNGSTMRPGAACRQCHSFTIAGTVYPTAHEPLNCNGVNGSTGVRVVITGANGTTLTLTPSAAGNFYSNSSVSMPFTAKVTNSAGGSRAMVASQTSGDCNSCHTQNGTSNAPGRIMTP